MPLTRPVWLWQHRFSRHGVLTEQHETIFVSRTSNMTPSATPANLLADGIVQSRWWTPAELSACAEEVWPHGLAALLPELLQGTLDPESPQDLGFTRSRPRHEL